MPEVRVTRQSTAEWVLPNLPDMDEQQSKAAYRAMSSPEFATALENTGVEDMDARADDQRIWVKE